MKEKLTDSELDNITGGGDVIGSDPGYKNIKVGTRYSVTWSDARGSGKFEGTVTLSDPNRGVRFDDITFISGDNKPTSFWTFSPSRMQLTAI